MKIYASIVSSVLVTLLAGCDTGPQSPRGFSLPEGNGERGQQAFVALQCTACHTVSGIDLPEPEQTSEIRVLLGGATKRVRTYGELVTSIINPSHKLAVGYVPEAILPEQVSKMRNYNDVMTVSQLIDLVAFLQASYQVQIDFPTEYRPYPYP